MMEDHNQKTYNPGEPPPKKDLSTFSGWAIVFILFCSLGILASMGSCVQFHYLNGGVLSPSYLLLWFVGFILRISMLALLARRNKWFRIPYYVECGLSVLLFVLNGFPLVNIASLVVALLWLFYVIFSKRLKYITGELPKKAPNTWNQPPPPPLYESLARIAPIQEDKKTTFAPPVAPAFAAMSAAPPAPATYQSPADEKARFCKKCGTKVDENQTRCVNCGTRTRLFVKKAIRAKRPVLIVLAVLLAVSVGGNIFLGVSAVQYEKNQSKWMAEWEHQRLRAETAEEKLMDAESTAVRLQSKLDDAESQAQTNWYLVLTYKEKAFFLDKYIAIVIPAIGNAYHKLDCPLIPSQYSFWAYIIEEAKNQGYYPCPNCH